MKHQTKFIFVTGGVVSSVGKGLVAASIGALLETRGLKIGLTKADPYLNIDPGTMSPIQHGEVFITDDGAETDLDLGHYERFTHASISRKNSFTTGQVYDYVITKEREGAYLGKTVQVIPNITDEIARRIYLSSEGLDVCIVEIGGTIGDIESLPFLETIRQIRYSLSAEHVLFLHVTLVPYIAAAKEIKTKPTQHSVKELRSIGITPDVLICRADRELGFDIKQKIALFCNVKKEEVFEALDVDNIYRLPLIFHQQGLDQVIVEKLGIWTKKPDLSTWQEISYKMDHPKDFVKIALVGKYTHVVDSYKSIEESLIHAGISTLLKVELEYVDSFELENTDASKLSAYDGIIVPGGFGERGKKGKMLAIQYAREHKTPFLGICLGMQLAAIEFARNVLGLKEASSQEFLVSTPHPIIHLMEDQKNRHTKGANMRLGSYECEILPGTKLFDVYQKKIISERHRHRYEFNKEYESLFLKAGAIFSGKSSDKELFEAFELKDHPYFLGCQYHPEVKSKPMAPHPLFIGLVEAAYEYKKKRVQKG